MSDNALVPVDRQAQAMAIFAGGANPFEAAARAEGVGDGVFGRFNGNTGDFIVGDETLEPGAQVMFEFLDAKQTWLGFDKQNKPVRGPEVTFLSGNALPDHDETPGVRWIKQIVVPIVTMDGTRVIYSAKAEKPTRPIWRLLKAYSGLMVRNRDAATGKFMVPIVEMGSASFQMMVNEPIKLKNGMFDIDPATNQPRMEQVQVTKYREDYKIVGWMSEEDVGDLVSGVQDEEQGMVEVNHVEEADYQIIEPEKPAATAPAPQPQGQRRQRVGMRA